MAEFADRSPRRLWPMEESNIVYLPNDYDIGQDGLFRKDGICELIRIKEINYTNTYALPFQDQSLLVFIESLRFSGSSYYYRLAIEDGRFTRDLRMFHVNFSDEQGVVIPVTDIRIIDQVRSGVFKVRENGWLFGDSRDNKIGDLTLLNDKDLAFRINPPMMAEEDLSLSEVRIQVHPDFAGRQFTVLLFRDVTHSRMPPDGVVLTESGELVPRRISRVRQNAP